MSNSLNIMSAEELIRAPRAVLSSIVASLLSEGLHVFCGASKTGKSWLMLWLCLCVAKGDAFWNCECRRGAALYLCLDDTYQRIQSRLYKLEKKAPPDLYFCNNAHSLCGGFLQQMNTFLEEHPFTSLIVIDPLDQVRDVPGSPRGYPDLGPLRELAHRRHTAILCVDRPKSKHATFVDMLCDGVDSMFFLELENRFSSGAWLYCVGKDIRTRKLRLRLSGTVWELCEGQQYASLSEQTGRR